MSFTARFIPLRLRFLPRTWLPDASDWWIFHVLLQKNHFDTLKLIYSVGYGVSLAALLIAGLVFCCFRSDHVDIGKLFSRERKWWYFMMKCFLSNWWIKDWTCEIFSSISVFSIFLSGSCSAHATTSTSTCSRPSSSGVCVCSSKIQCCLQTEARTTAPCPRWGCSTAWTRLLYIY